MQGWKKIVSEFLGFLKYKVDNDLLTMEEVESIARAMESGIEVMGTAEDFSRFYGQPRTNISSVINRRMLAKPKRRVFYPFRAFQKIIPKTWGGHA